MGKSQLLHLLVRDYTEKIGGLADAYGPRGAHTCMCSRLLQDKQTTTVAFLGDCTERKEVTQEALQARTCTCSRASQRTSAAAGGSLGTCASSAR